VIHDPPAFKYERHAFSLGVATKSGALPGGTILNRRALRFSAIIGAAAVSTLAIAPVFAASTPVSQATAQALDLKIAGNSLISQIVTSSNDGTTETKNNASTLPTIASVVPGNSLLGAGVLPQDAVSKSDGTSYACAGLAGTGGGIVKVGNSSCKLNGKPVTIDLAHLSLGNALLGNDSALGSALNGLPGIGTLLGTLSTTLDGLVTQISGAVAGTPLGSLSIGGALSAIEASCQADPTAATGDARLVDSSGGSDQIPISITLPGVPDPIVLLNLPANPPPNTHVLTNLNVVTASLISAVKTELATALQGKLAGLGLGTLLTQVQTAVIDQLVANLQPLLQPLEQYIADIILNKQVSSDNGRKIEVTALDAQVLPALQQFAGASLIGGEIGKVTCGPNPPTTTPTENPPGTPTVVDSGLTGASHTTRDVLMATTALMLLAGTAGLIGYRRILVTK
jgi:hypothetical protein